MSIDAVERLQRIEAKARTDGRVRVVDLASELDVSEMPIRRDLDVLAEQGRVQRIRGGALAIGPEPSAERFTRHMRAKDRIAGRTDRHPLGEVAPPAPPLGTPPR